MIRPITCLAALLACGSGLYLYQEKHRVQLLDQQIEQTVHQADQMREQTRMLHAEWTLLNDPQRLRQLADQFLHLQTVAPGQFTDMAHLDSRLPPVPPPAPAVPAETTDMPVAEGGPAAPGGAAQPAGTPVAQVQAATPAAAKPAEPARVAQDKPATAGDAATRPTDAVRIAQDRPHDARKPAPPAERVRVAQSAADHVVAQHLPAPRPWQPALAPRADPQIREVHYEPRWQPPRPEPRWQPPRGMAATPVYARTGAPAPAGGSMLGMAHDTPHLPAPMPMQSRTLEQMFPMSNGGG